MAVPRPLLLALLGVALFAVTMVTTQSARQSADAENASEAVNRIEVAEPAPKPAAPAKREPKADKGEKKQGADKNDKKQQPADSKAQEQRAERRAEARRRERLRERRLAGPLAVSRAVRNGKVAVLFLRQPNGADDSATAEAVRSVKGGDVAVFEDSVGNLERYGAILAAADVSQAPAVVIVTRKDAEVLEGFVDKATLRQEVSDARG